MSVLLTVVVVGIGVFTLFGKLPLLLEAVVVVVLLLLLLPNASLRKAAREYCGGETTSVGLRNCGDPVAVWVLFGDEGAGEWCRGDGEGEWYLGVCEVSWRCSAGEDRGVSLGAGGGGGRGDWTDGVSWC